MIYRICKNDRIRNRAIGHLKKVNQEFNSSAKCTQVVSFVSQSIGSTGGKRIKLSAGFPPADIDDLSLTVTAAGIANAAVTVKLE